MSEKEVSRRAISASHPPPRGLIETTLIFPEAHRCSS
jgi:hypothetical protein